MFSMLEFIKLAEKYDFAKYLKFIINHNKSNMAPYHNFYHTQMVVINSNFIIKNEDQSDCHSHDSIRELLIASLFHDFNHSQGLHKDKYNVQNSIDSFIDISNRVEDKENSDFENFQNNVSFLIKSTEYPYVFPDQDNLPLRVKVIRDADLCQVFTDNSFHQNVMGLSKELGIPIEVFIKDQLKFLDNLKFYTNYCIEKYDGEFISAKNLKKIEVLYFAKILGVNCDEYDLPDWDCFMNEENKNKYNKR